MKAPFRLDNEQAQNFGFAPGAYALPTTDNNLMFIVGLTQSFDRLLVSKNVFRARGMNLVRTQFKTYNYCGVFSDIDVNSHGFGDYLERLSGSYKFSPDAIRNIFNKPMSEVNALCRRVIGDDVLAQRALPGGLSVINRALDYVKSGRKDHARLLLQWPAFTHIFVEVPDILDRSVAGESMWDLFPHEFSPAMINEIKKIKHFDMRWVEPGVPAEVYMAKLAGAASLLPQGAQRPETAIEATSLVNINRICEQVFRSLSNGSRHRAKTYIFANSGSWKNTTEVFEADYAYDFVNFLYHDLIMPAFAVNGVTVSEDKTVDALFHMLSTNIFKIGHASKAWHSTVFQDASRKDDVTLPSSWPAAFKELSVPVLDDGFSISIVPLDTAEALANEGVKQHHCIKGHRRYCVNGSMRIVSIREGEENQILSTASLIIHGGQLEIREHRGFANSDPCPEAKNALAWFEGSVNGGTGSFQFDKNWQNLGVSGTKPSKATRDDLSDNFEKNRHLFGKRMVKGGLDALLEVCR